MRAAVLVAAAAFAGNALAAGGDAGERAFQHCYSCHSVKAGETGTQGPNLRGVVGRRAGTLSVYAFSPAMIEAGKRGLIWTPAAIDAFIADSERFLPGTTMATPPLRDATLRREVIGYLQRVR